ncbi:MAG: hypothetical protein R2710_00755 [Acidimicrobiales bacterium]
MPPPSPDLVEPSTSGAELIRRRRLLLFVAAVIAGAGVAYELSLMLRGTVTIGSTERANAIVLGTAMLGMGVGATNGGRWAGRPVAAFIRVEMVLALLGAGAAPLLYWTWARLDAFWGPLLGVAFAIGVCIGAEMPLLAALNERLAAQSPTKVVADYTAADYFGALVGAIAFAFVVRPFFGIVEGTVLVAVVNLLAAAAVALIVPGSDPRRVVPLLVGGAGALAALALVSPTIVADGQQAQFRDPIVAAVDSGIQELVVTSRTHPGGVVDTRLFLDGDLQLSSVDEFRYHEALVHPAVTGAANVLILGGGDCLAAREILRHPEVESITMVELDSGVVELMRTVPELAVLPNGACDDPRLQIVNDDAFTWVDRRASEGRVGFDAVIVDFPIPTLQHWAGSTRWSCTSEWGDCCGPTVGSSSSVDRRSLLPRRSGPVPTRSRRLASSRCRITSTCRHSAIGASTSPRSTRCLRRRSWPCPTTGSSLPRCSPRPRTSRPTSPARTSTPGPRPSSTRRSSRPLRERGSATGAEARPPQLSTMSGAVGAAATSALSASTCPCIADRPSLVILNQVGRSRPRPVFLTVT